MSYYGRSRSSVSMTFNAILPDYETFLEMTEKVGWEPNNPELLYDILASKYLESTTRFMTPMSFMRNLKANLRVFWENLSKQMELEDTIRDLKLDQIIMNVKSVSNTVTGANDPTVDASEVPIPFSSTDQDTYYEVGNIMDAVNQHYSSLFKNNVDSLYKKIGHMFRVVVISDTEYLYGG